MSHFGDEPPSFACTGFDRFQPQTSRLAGNVGFRPSEWPLLRKAAVRFDDRDRRKLTHFGHR